MAPQFNPPSWQKPDNYEWIGQATSGLDNLFNAYQKNKMAGMQTGLQYAAQGIDPVEAFQNPQATYGKLIEQHRATQAQKTAQIGLDTRLKESEITKNLNTGKPQSSKTEGDLRGELQKLSKPFFETRDAYGRIEASAKNPTAAGDLAMIFNYMKILDPGSTVREGEFANAQNSGSLPSRVIAAYNGVLKGERLAPEMRTDFLSRARDLYGSQKSMQALQEDAYRGLSTRLGVSPENVILDLGVPVQQGTVQSPKAPGKYDHMTPEQLQAELERQSNAR